MKVQIKKKTLTPIHTTPKQVPAENARIRIKTPMQEYLAEVIQNDLIKSFISKKIGIRGTHITDVLHNKPASIDAITKVLRSLIPNIQFRIIWFRGENSYKEELDELISKINEEEVEHLKKVITDSTGHLIKTEKKKEILEEKAEEAYRVNKEKRDRETKEKEERLAKKKEAEKAEAEKAKSIFNDDDGSIDDDLMGLV